MMGTFKSPFPTHVLHVQIFQVVEEQSPPALQKWFAAEKHSKQTMYDYAVCRRNVDIEPIQTDQYYD